MFDKDDLNKLYRYALSLTVQQEAAYDLLQGALERYLKKSSLLIDNPNAYLKTIIRNLFIDSERRSKLVPMVSLEGDDTNQADGSIFDSPSNSSIDDILINQQQVQQLTKRLTSEENELLYLWAVEEYTTSEIATIFQQPKGTILSKLHRLKKRIRDHAQITNMLVE